MRKKGWKLAVILLTVGLLAAGCGKSAEKQEETTAAVAESTAAATDDTAAKTTDAAESTAAEAAAEVIFGSFTTQTLTGETATEEIFSEKALTMVNIWGTFCGPCINEMPDLGEISREYADQEFQIVGIVSDVTEAEDETAMEILEETGADYTHLVLSRDLYDGYLSQVQVVPTTVFVDQDGRQVGEIYYGSKSKEDWLKIIEDLMNS